MSMAVASSPPASRSRRRAARAAAAVVAAAALGVAAVRGRDTIAASLMVLGHLPWLWIPVAIVLEAASMTAFACLQRRLLATGGARIGVAAMLGTSLAANALSVSIPLAGPEVAAAFTFRRYRQQGADAPLAGWSLLAGGVISAATVAIVVLGGGLASGNALATGIAVPTGVLGVAGLLAFGAAARRPRLAAALGHRVARILGSASRFLRRPVPDPAQIIRAWADRLGSLQLGSTGWTTVLGLGMVNWLADAAVLVVSIRAAGGHVPWNDFLLVYGSGVAAQSLNITPGGIGVAEGAMSLALIATGLRASQALAAVLLYRLASFWLIAAAGWLILLLLRHRRRARRLESQSGPPIGQALDRGATAGRSERSSDMSRAGRRHHLVLLHGQPGSPADWDSVAELLPAHVRVVAPDRPGYGINPRPPGGFAVGANALAVELNERRIRRAVLVGHSYGGGVALSAAQLMPDRVAAVVLVASVGPGCVNIWDKLLAAPVTGPACALITWKLTPWIARARLAVARRSAGFGARPDNHPYWQVWGHGENASGTLWRTFLIEQRALLREITHLTRALPSIQLPVLVIADPRDSIVGPETAHRLAAELPGARLLLISGAGHHLPRRAPAAVADAISAFLADLDAVQPDCAVPEPRGELAAAVRT